MKYIISVALGLSLLAFSTISEKNNLTVYNITSDTLPPKAKNNKSKDDPRFDFPESVNTDTGRASFVKMFNKGQIVYSQICVKCHNVVKEGKNYYPDFSLPQLMDYEIRFQYEQHVEDLKESNMTAEELDWVVHFLRYKKVNLPYTGKLK
jgi:hypothetical protein